MDITSGFYPDVLSSTLSGGTFLSGCARVGLRGSAWNRVDCPVGRPVGSNPTILTIYRRIAQSGSASALGAEGQVFESLYGDHFKRPIGCLSGLP